MTWRTADWLHNVPALIPAAAASLFILHFASSVPLTDDWLFVRNAMIAAQEGSLLHIHWWIYDHLYVLPNLFFLIIGPLTAYDARYILFSGVATGLILLQMLRRPESNGLALLALSLIIFSPARFTLYQWPIITYFMWSVAFGTAGLVVLDRITATETHFIRKLAAGLLLTACGALSSAGGVFAFAAAAWLCAMKDWTTPRRLLGAAAALILFTASCLIFSNGKTGGTALLSLLPLKILTMIGGSVTGTPLSLTEFGFDLQSTLGAGILLLVAACAAASVRRARTRALALPLACVIFGLGALAAIALNRPDLGNRHAVFATPILIGAVLAIETLPKPDLRRGLLAALILLTASGYAIGFAVLGPDYASRVKHFERELAIPGATGYSLVNDPSVDRQLIAFVRRHGHPFFRNLPEN